MIVCFAISLVPVGIIGGIQGFESTSVFLIILIAIVTFVSSIIVSYMISRSIEKLTKDIDNISKGKLDVELEKSEIYEINRLTEALDRVMVSLKLAIHKVGVKKGEIFEETIREKEKVEGRYRNLLDSISGFVWEIDPKGVFVSCSKNVSDILGYGPGTLIGKTIFEFMPSDDARKLRKVLKGASKKNGSLKDIEMWHLDKNGKKVCMNTNGVPLFDKDENLLGYCGVEIDITKTKNVEAKIEELDVELVGLKERVARLLNERNKRRPRKLARANRNIEDKWTEDEFDSVYLFDENAGILDCNENMYRNLGYTKSEVLSLDIADFDALESKKDIWSKMEEIKEKGSISFKSIHRRKDGSAVLVHENFQYLKDKNMFKCIVREDYSLKK